MCKIFRIIEYWMMDEKFGKRRKGNKFSFLWDHHLFMENTRLHLLVKYRTIQVKLIFNFSINENIFWIPKFFRCTQIFVQTQTQKIANITLQMMKTVEYHICWVWVSIPKRKLNCIHTGIVKAYTPTQQHIKLETMSSLLNALIAFQITIYKNLF